MPAVSEEITFSNRRRVSQLHQLLKGSMPFPPTCVTLIKTSLGGLPGIFRVTTYTHILRKKHSWNGHQACKVVPHFSAWSKFRQSPDHRRESVPCAGLTPAHATDFHLQDFRSHYHTNELLFRSVESLCLIECAFYPRCSCSTYQGFR